MLQKNPPQQLAAIQFRCFLQAFNTGGTIQQIDVAVGSTCRDKLLKALNVEAGGTTNELDCLGSDCEEAGDIGVLGECFAQARERLAEVGIRGCLGLIGPEHCRELLARLGPIRLQRQIGQQTACSAGCKGHRLVFPGHVERTQEQQREPHGCPDARALLRSTALLDTTSSWQTCHCHQSGEQCTNAKRGLIWMAQYACIIIQCITQFVTQHVTPLSRATAMLVRHYDNTE
jgi:hypothetical protein